MDARWILSFNLNEQLTVMVQKMHNIYYTKEGAQCSIRWTTLIIQTIFLQIKNIHKWEKTMDIYVYNGHSFGTYLTLKAPLVPEETTWKDKLNEIELM